MILCQTTQPVWTPEAVGMYIIPAVVAGIISILAWWSARQAREKATQANVTATRADVKADATTEQVKEVRADVRSANEQITSVAQAQQPPKQ